MFSNRGIAARQFLPKSILALRHYSPAIFLSDLLAGITVGLVALPLAMAFAIASGVPPESGLYCAVVAGFVISALGGSRCQIGGPTGAFVVVVAGIIAKYGVDGLMMCTLMAGVLLILLGITGLGTVIQFIPRPVVIGFTNGIAVLIGSTQIKDFFGLQITKVPGEFIPRMQAIVANWHSLDPTTTAVATGSLIGIVLIRKLNARIPATVLVLGAATAPHLESRVAGRDNPVPIWWHPCRAAADSPAPVPAGPPADSALTSNHRRHAGCD